MPALPTKTGQEVTDKALLSIYRRLDALERAGRETVSFTRLGIGHLYTASGLTTVTARRWLAASASGTLGTGLATSGFIPVPSGFNRVTGMALAVNGNGTGTGTVTYTVTVGTSLTEFDSTLKITTLVTFSGVRLETGNVVVKEGDAIRVAVDKTATITGQPTGIGLMLILERVS